jgi:hypothetical protein
MKVKKLIEELKKHDGETEVFLEDWSEGYAPPTSFIAIQGGDLTYNYYKGVWENKPHITITAGEA